MLKKTILLLGVILTCQQNLEARKITVDKDAHPINLIVDTDCDLDDMMAILYLLNSPRIDIKAITTVGDGMSKWEYGAPNILDLLELAEHPHIPVAYGAKVSISPAGNFPSNWRNEANNVMGVKLPKNSAHPTHERSAELMTEIIEVIEDDDEPIKGLA